MKRLLIAVLILCSSFAVAQTEKLTAAEVLAKSVEAIGSEKLLKSIQYFELTGTATLRTTAGTGTASGTALLLSEGNMIKFATKFPQVGESYRGDQFVYDGKDVKVADIKPGVKSQLGQLIFWQKAIVKQGLLGGVLSRAWPGYAFQGRENDFSFEGKAKVDGHDAYKLRYRPKKMDSALSVVMFFDAETFRHVKTSYKVEIPAGFTVGTQEKGPSVARAGQATAEQNSYYELDETFSDFRTLGGLTIPLTHKLTYASNGAVTSNWFWEMTYDELNGSKIPKA